MTDGARLVIFVVVLVVALGLGLVIGAAVGPITADASGAGAVVQTGDVS